MTHSTQPTAQRFSNKTVLVTGGNSGIGLTAAQAFITGTEIIVDGGMSQL